MNQPRRDRLLAVVALAATLALALGWSCVPISAAYAQGEEEDNSGPVELETREHSTYLTINGVKLEISDPQCVQPAYSALLQRKPLPVDDECREVMMEALEIQRTTPPIPTTGPPAIQGRHRAGVRYLDPESATGDAKVQPPLIAAPNPNANQPLAEESP